MAWYLVKQRDNFTFTYNNSGYQTLRNASWMQATDAWRKLSEDSRCMVCQLTILNGTSYIQFVMNTTKT